MHDCLEHGWAHNQADYPEIQTLAINLDRGSATRSNRTQFIQQMVTFACQSGLTIELIYYPPDHSKYNSPVIYHLTKVYDKGAKIDAETLEAYRVDWHPSSALPKWAITLDGSGGYLNAFR